MAEAPAADGPEGPEADPTPAPAPELLHGVPVTRPRGDVVLHPTRDEYRPLVERLRGEGYWVCVDLCGVDYLGYAADRGLPPGLSPERFEVVVNLLSHTERTRVRLRVQVPESDPVLATVSDVHPGVHNHERETWDMFGIRFEGHPDPSRILMPDDWEGHPLRKDYSVGRIPVQFKDAPSAR